AARTLGALVDELAARQPQADAVVFRDRRLSYAAWRARAEDLARALLVAGVARGERVALLLPNRPEWLVAAVAVAKVGGVVTPLSTFSTARELGWALEHSGACVLLTAAGFRGRDYLAALRELCPELAAGAPGEARPARFPRLRAVVCVDERGGDGVFSLGAFLALGGRLGPGAVAAAQQAVTPRDLCYLLYTSGSTATPKGVTLAHGGVLENGFDIGERQHLTAADRLWLAVPLFWSFGSANALPAILTHGGTVVLQESFEAGEALELLERERCSVYYGMAHMARAMLEHPDRARRRLDAMRTGLTIGLPDDLAMTMEAVAVPELCNVYGATETYGNCAVTDAHDPRPLRLTTQGLPLPGMTIRVVDPESRRPLSSGEVGELCVRGHVTPGYHRAPELDRAAFDAEGFFLTGDLGQIGADGRLRFHGRLKELIKTGGINVAPLEVEQVLREHPAVAEAWVVGLPDRDRDEVVAAAVTLGPGATANAADLTAFCRARLSSYKVPGRLAVLRAEDVPRTPTGKVHKPGLRETLTREGVPPAGASGGSGARPGAAGP
ncbi:MAG TPA: AMP-binding protein, partial [Vicinamibacteria bacterium]|nr:AMP-binding protein [Vicinamibacteria bacterium]